MQDMIYKSPKIADQLLKKNIKSLNFNFSLLEENEDEGNRSQYEFFISEEKLKTMISKSIRLDKPKRWYMGNWGAQKVNIFAVLNKSNELENKEDSDKYDIDDIMSTVSEISLPNQTRNKIREIMTTRSIDEYFPKSEGEESVSPRSKPNTQLNSDKFKLLAIKENTVKTIQKTKIKNKNRNKIMNHDDFVYLYKNFYSFRKIFPDSNKITTKLNTNYHFDIKINKYLLYLYYSNVKDYLIFVENRDKLKKINTSRSDFNGLAVSHRGLNYFIQNYNKVTKDISLILSSNVNKRREKIEQLREKLDSVKILHTENEDINNLRVMSYMDLIFYPPDMNLPNKNDLIEKYNVKKKVSKNKKMYNKNYFDNKFIENVHSNNNATNMEYSLIMNENNKSTYYQNFHIEISPVTENKNFLNFYSEINQKANNDINIAKKRSILQSIDQISNLTIMSIEVFCEGQEELTWHYERDQILAIMCVVHDENSRFNYSLSNLPYFYYKFIITTYPDRNISKRYNYNNYIIGPEYLGFKKDKIDYDNLTEIFQTKDEIGLFLKFIELFNKFDPDIIVGYETEMLSISYVIRRAEFLGIPIRSLISRNNTTDLANNYTEQHIREILRKKINEGLFKKSASAPITDHMEIKYLEQKFGKVSKITGRILMNLWRLLEGELKLINYKLENVVFHFLKIREASFKQSFLLKLYESNEINKVLFILNYYMKRAKYNLILLDDLDIISRDAQFTKSKKK